MWLVFLTLILLTRFSQRGSLVSGGGSWADHMPCGCSGLISISRRWGWARHLPGGWPDGGLWSAGGKWTQRRAALAHAPIPDLTRPWTCCFYSPNNGWRPSMSSMRSRQSFWTYLVVLNSLASSFLTLQTVCLWHSKANSTHSFLMSSTLVNNVWHSTESFQLLSLSRLECPKAVFWVQLYS